MNNVIECNGFKARIMEADRLVGSEKFGLPPGKPLPIYKVSSFKQRPEHWMDDEGSVVVPVQANKGLWFDWTLNDPENTAVLPSVKGCNPITGQQLNGFSLEAYKNKCPIHGVEFEKDHYCPVCGYKWPSQNYVSSPNYLWNDGWRDADGTVRQFFFTEDMMRDIASHKLGTENTVPAFGFAFYTPVEKHMSVIYDKTTGTFRSQSNSKAIVIKGKPERSRSAFGSTTLATNTALYSSAINSIGNVAPRGLSIRAKSLADASVSSYCCATAQASLSSSVNNVFSDNIAPDNCLVDAFDITLMDEFKSKEVAVGAGAIIEQKILDDKYGIETWKDVPDAVMRVYFVFQDEFDKWASHGFVGEKESMLNGLPVG